MIPDKNPFRPSFGASPVQLAGREFEISSFNYGLLGGVGAMQRALLVSGTRGVGKTVLLNEFEESARRLGQVPCSGVAVCAFGSVFSSVFEVRRLAGCGHHWRLLCGA